MRRKQLALLVLATSTALLPAAGLARNPFRSAKEPEPTGSQAHSGKLKGYVQETNLTSKSWLGSPVEDIDNSFTQFAATGGTDLYDEVPKDMLTILASGGNGWSHRVDDSKEHNVLYPDWNAWHGGIHRAMYQIRWELLTDPQQKVCRLGPSYNIPSGTSLWQAMDSPRKGLVIHNCWYPALSRHAYLTGHARILIEIHPGKRLQSKVLVSTMTPEATARLKDSLDALNGHPVLSYPVKGTKCDTIPIVVNFGFDNSEWLNKEPTQ